MPYREFQDAAGRSWEVWEVNPESSERSEAELHPGVPQTLTGGWLAFQCKSERRRLAPIPQGWCDCNEEQLLALLESAEMKSSTRRLIE
jgi:hypothetical protein